jgi:hypothetical protein
VRESLEKMLAKGVDNPLLRFGLGKAWLDEGNGAEAAVHLALWRAGSASTCGVEAAGQGLSVAG